MGGNGEAWEDLGIDWGLELELNSGQRGLILRVDTALFWRRCKPTGLGIYDF